MPPGLPNSGLFVPWHKPQCGVLGAVQVFTVESKKAATFTVEFAPQELGTFNHEMYLRVNNNPFEQYKIALTGTGTTLCCRGVRSSRSLPVNARPACLLPAYDLFAWLKLKLWRC
jgi:hypothetical protein